MIPPSPPPPIPSFGDVGLPEGHAYPELAYHAPTNSIIVHTRPLDSVLPIRRLSIRRTSEFRYRLMDEFPPSVSVESFVLSVTQPVLYLLTYTWSEYPNGPPGGSWEALYRFNLETGMSEVIVRHGELMPESPHRPPWLNKLISISADDCKLFCKVGFQTSDSNAHYYLAALTIADGKLTLISKLPAVFA